MRKFKFFSLLLVIASFSTVFAAWSYFNYATEYKSGKIKITFENIDASDMDYREAITVKVTNTEPLTVSYTQAEDDMLKAEASLSDDIYVEVIENINGAIDRYDFYYMFYSPNGSIGSVKYTSTPSYKDMTLLELDENNRVVIKAEDVEDIFDQTFELTTVSETNLKKAIEEFNEKMDLQNNNIGVNIEIFAKRVD